MVVAAAPDGGGGGNCLFNRVFVPPLRGGCGCRCPGRRFDGGGHTLAALALWSPAPGGVGEHWLESLSLTWLQVVDLYLTGNRPTPFATQRCCKENVNLAVFETSL